MKKLIGFILALVMSIGCLGTAYATDLRVSVMVNGETVNFTDTKPFIDENGRTLVPLRAVADAMNLTVEWDETNKKVSFSGSFEIGNGASYGNYLGKGNCCLTDYEVVFTIDSNTYTANFSGADDNGTPVGSGRYEGEMDTAPIIRDNRTYAPIRYLAEEFGYAIVWDQTTLTAWVSNENDMKMGHELCALPTAYEGVLAEVIPNIETLNSCILEVFGADTDFDLDYRAVYESEAAYANGSGTPMHLYGIWESIEPSVLLKYFDDPTASSYFPVKNFKTNADVRNNLRKYMSDEIIDEYFHDDFLEYNGTLFLKRGSRGYGAEELDMDSLKLVEEKDEMCLVSADVLFFGETDGSCIVELTKTADGWIITSVTKQ